MISTAIPNWTLEHIAIAEYLLLVDTISEVPDRKYDNMKSWTVLANVNTELNDETEEECNKRWASKIELQLSGVADELFEARGRDGDEEGTNAQSAEYVLDPSSLGSGGQSRLDADGDDADDGEVGNGTANNAATSLPNAREESISIGSKRKMKVRRANLNEKGWKQNIFRLKEQEGTMKNNLIVTRARSNRRKSRIQEVNEDGYI